MPLRDLYYVSDIYSRDCSDEDLYSSKMIKIKTPRFVVFYNGRDIQEECFEYKLSDMFENHDEEPSLELNVKVYNIKDFLMRNREAVMHTSLYEYDEEKHIKNEKKISYEDGVHDGVDQEKRDAIEKLASHFVSQDSELSLEEARKKAMTILG